MYKRMSLLVIVMLILCSQADATTVAYIDYAGQYSDAMLNLHIGDYEMAAQLFGSISGYADSADWADYAQALWFIENDDIPSARALLEIGNVLALENANAQAWLYYCEGREAERKGLTYAAREAYGKAMVARVADSAESYRRMEAHIIGNTREPLVTPTPAPKPVYRQVPGTIKSVSEVKVYAGPSTDGYMVQTKLTDQTRIDILGCVIVDQTRWLLISYGDVGRKKCGFVNALRVEYEGNVGRETHEKLSKHCVNANIQPLAGPGEGYQVMETTISKGTYVLAVITEMEYVMIEYEGKKGTERAWIPFDCLD